MDILVPRFEANEIAKAADFDYGNDQEYANLCILLEELFSGLTNDMIVRGLVCQERGTPSMNVDLSIGLGYCKNTGKIAHTGSLFGPVSIASGGAQQRIDVIEIRLKETDYDSQQRAMKDPVSGDISYQDVNTKTRFEIEAQVIAGVEGAGIASAHTANWIKIAEVTVDASETTSILDADIKNCTGGYDGEVTANWTAETAVTFKLGNVENLKAIFRIKHKEDGDHVNDVIRDQHIDWGTGADQVKAILMPIVDAGTLIIATEVETALQELAGARVPVGTIVSMVDGYFADGNNGSFTLVSVPLTANWELCDGSVLNDAQSPIFNGAGRYLPNLTDDRFLMGDIAGNLGAIGGYNDMLAHTHGFTQPSAHGITQPTFNGPSHAHSMAHTHNQGTLIALSNPVGGAFDDISIKQVATASWTPTHRVATTAILTDPVAQTGATDVTGNTGDVSTPNTGAGGTQACTRIQDVALTNNHSGGSVNAVSESRTGKNIPKYLACKYIMRIK